ncbi:NAD(P)H-dependent oxidoreductase [Candidatus Peregrinibacteria bacterium]|nr:NAD(P)H-dependent oxidoreductase [Candidatus Peregrinibacteria bacterium]
MNYLIIYAHPKATSFTHALKSAFIKGANEGSHSVKSIDLYAEGFDPLLRTPELHGADNPEVQRHQELIRWADWMVFIYPVWWFGAPAVLEGWFEKVFSSEFAFHYKKLIGRLSVPVGLLPCKKVVVIESYGGPAWAARWIYGNWGWKRIKKGILKFCGVKKIIHVPCWFVPFTTDGRRRRYLKKVQKLARRLK